MTEFFFVANVRLAMPSVSTSDRGHDRSVSHKEKPLLDVFILILEFNINQTAKVFDFCFILKHYFLFFFL